MATATNGDIEIHYQDHGGAGLPVIFSHGFLMGHEMFDAQVDALRDSHRCITWDQRGHGDTEATGPFTYWDSAADLCAVLDHLGIENAVLAGMSQGGFLSLRAALTAPQRVAGLFLIDTQAGTEDPATTPMYETLVAAWMQGASEDIARTVASIIVGPEGQDPWVDRWLKEPPGRIEEPFKTLVGREDIHDRLGEITAPAAIVHGSDDVAIPLERAHSLCDGLSGCTGVTVIEGAGHASNMTSPEAVNEVLARFLASLA